MNPYEYQRSRSFIDLRPKITQIQQFQTFFSLETAGPIETKFHVESPWHGGTKVYSNGPGHWSHDQIGHHAHIW